MIKNKQIQEATAVSAYSKGLDKKTKFIPAWVKVAVACFLGFGTMMG